MSKYDCGSRVLITQLLMELGEPLNGPNDTIELRYFIRTLCSFTSRSVTIERGVRLHLITEK
jgi:hypothetical protein